MNLLQKNLWVCFKVSNALGVAMKMENAFNFAIDGKAWKERIGFCDRNAETH